MDEDLEKRKKKFVFLFEIAKRSFLTCQHLIAKIKPSLNSFENAIDNNITLGGEVAISFIDASAFIDYAHRFHSVVDALPFISKKSPELVRLRNHMEIVTELRNYLQHIREDLTQNEKMDFDILGSLSWINKNVCYTISMSQPFPGRSFGIAYNKEERAWVTNYQYEINQKIVDLDLVLNEMSLAFKFISTKASFAEYKNIEPVWGQTAAFKLVINHNSTK